MGKKVDQKESTVKNDEADSENGPIVESEKLPEDFIRAHEITIVDVESVVFNPRNANTHSNAQIDRLCEEIKRQGFRNPIVISNRSGFLLAGHGRIMALKKLGWKKVPAIFQDFKNEAEEYLYLINDNEIARWAVLDYESLHKSIGEIEGIDSSMIAIPDFKGIDDVDIDVLAPEEINDNIPNVTNPITRKGDVWILGNHRLMCGDSRMFNDVEKLMNGNRAQIAFTSPPYNAGDEVEIGSKGHKYETHNDAMKQGDYLELLKDFTQNTLAFCDLSIVNIQQLSGNKISFIDYLHHFKNNLVDIAIWNKTHGTPCLPKRVMNSAFEYVLFFSNEQNPPKTIKTAPMFHGNVNNVYNGEKQTRNEFSQVHRATFPVHLPHYFIDTFSQGDVIELFNGTGTTLMVCDALGRKCYSMEIDPLYVDVTIKRWQNATKRSAILESTGEKYDDLVPKDN